MVVGGERYQKVALDERDEVVQPSLFGEGGPALDVPGVVGDADDGAADGRGDGARGPADAAAQVEHPHALLEAGQLGVRLFVGHHALPDGEAGRERRVVELLAPGFCQGVLARGLRFKDSHEHTILARTAA